jgi:hypothetical protein
MSKIPVKRPKQKCSFSLQNGNAQSFGGGGPFSHARAYNINSYHTAKSFLALAVALGKYCYKLFSSIE